MRKRFGMAFGAIFLLPPVFAQDSSLFVSYSTPGAVYFQDFNGLPATGTFTLSGKGPHKISAPPVNGSNLSGWQFLMTAGTNSAASFAISTGSSTGNGVYSLGASGSTDRALGSLSSSSGIYAFGVLFTNKTGGILNKLTIQFTAEQWRKGGSGIKNTWSCKYKTGSFSHIQQTNLVDVPGLNFSSPVFTTAASSLNGNLAINQQSINFVLDSLVWKNGEQLLLRWDDADEAGSDDAVALDDFSCKAELVYAQPTILNTRITDTGTSRATLLAEVRDNYAKTSLVAEIDTSANFTTATYFMPVPDSIPAAGAQVGIQLNLTGLLSGKKYYARIRATNSAGITRGPAISFQTEKETPVVITDSAVGITNYTAVLGGKILTSDSAGILERGIVWSAKTNPTLLDNKILMGKGAGNFRDTLPGLPEGTLIYARAYAQYTGGTIYGNQVSFYTKTKVTALSAILPVCTNLDSVVYELSLPQNISGIQPANFTIHTHGISNTAIQSIRGSDKKFYLTLYTGSGNGLLYLTFSNDTGITPSVSNLPFTARDTFQIDKSAPVINSVAIPDRKIIAGDSIPVTIGVVPDTANYVLKNGKINNLPLTGFLKINDSTYHAFIYFSPGSADRAANEIIPVYVALTDAVGNTGEYNRPISLVSGYIDVNSPGIKNVFLPRDGIYKMGDTLDFRFLFTEKIRLTGSGSPMTFSLTVGYKSKTAVYLGGSESDTLLFRYVVQPGDYDKDGIKPGTSFSVNGNYLSDIAGNPAVLSFSHIPSAKNILVDGIAPTVSSVITPAAGTYRTGDTLNFTITFSEKIILDTSRGKPSLPVTIGNSECMALFLKDTVAALQFQYRVNPNDYDMDGIKLLSPILLNNALLKDAAGNEADRELHNIGALSKIILNPRTLPKLLTFFPDSISTTSAILGGRVTDAGGTAILERGIVWSTAANPGLSANKVTMPLGPDSFGMKIKSLPQGTSLHARAFATNAKGTAYGNDVPFTTETTLLDILPLNKLTNNLSYVNFQIQTAQGISGISKSNFLITSQGLDSVSIHEITGSAKTHTASIYTGKGDGTIGLTMVNDTGISPSLSNDPFTSKLSYTIDRTPPTVLSITIPDRPMKIGDTVPVSILVKKDTDSLLLNNGFIAGFPLILFTKTNDSSYSAKFIVKEGGTDIPKSADIPVSFQCRDLAGNNSLPFIDPIKGQLTQLDANSPKIKSVQIPENGLYKTGDTLHFIVRFTENIRIIGTGSPVTFSITVGARVKMAEYIAGNGSDSLHFRYLIQPGESDTDGVKMANTLSLNGNVIHDFAGNKASLAFPVTGSLPQIFIDGIPPVITSVNTPAAGTYKTGSLLNFKVNFSEKVYVDTTQGKPSLGLTIGKNKIALPCISGAGSSALAFQYSVGDKDATKNGLTLEQNLTLNGSILRDEAGNDVLLPLKNIGSLSKIMVNPVSATVSSILLPVPKTYIQGDSLLFKIVFTESIMVNIANGIPSLRITMGTKSKEAYYRSGSGTDTLSFLYLIIQGDQAHNGISLYGSILPNNGVLTDVLQNNIPLTLGGIPDLKEIKVDAVAPFVQYVITPTKNTYREGDTLSFLIHFSEPVYVRENKGSVWLQVYIGNQLVRANYTKGHQTEELQCQYRIEKNNLDKNGIKLDSMIYAFNTDITDNAGNPAILGLKNIGALSYIKVDAVAPEFVLKEKRTDSLCENSTGLDVSASLEVWEEEIGELLSWEIISPPKHGNLPKTVYTANANGKSILPKGIIYQPEGKYTGQDSLLVKATDGVNSTEKKIYLFIYPDITDNQTGPNQLVCINNAPSVITGTIPSGGNGQYLHTWELSNYTDPVIFTKANGAINGQHYYPPKLSQSTWFRRKVISGDCISVSSPTRVQVLLEGVWTGNDNNNWNHPGNWCNQRLPDKQTDVTILAGTPHFPIIKDSAFCNHLTIANNAILVNEGSLLVDGIINDTSGMIETENGNIVFRGNAPQKIPSKIFRKQTINTVITNNPSQIFLQDSLNLSGSLLLQKGQFVTGNLLTLGPNARVGATAQGASISGEVCLEHIIRTNKPVYLILGNPFNKPFNLDQLKDSIDITGEGGASNGFVNAGGQQPSAFKFLPRNGTDSLGFENGWTPFTRTNGENNNTWDPLTGIKILVRGRPGQGLDGTPPGDGKNGTYLPQPVQLNLRGSLFTGEQEVFLDNPGKPAFQVIANPYISSINTRFLQGNKGMGNYFWVWNTDQGKNGGYSAVSFKEDYILPRMGSFIIRMTDSSVNKVLFTENCKTTGGVTNGIPLSGEEDAFHLELRLETDSLFYDRILLLAIDSAKTFRDKLDAVKINNPSVNFYSLSKDGFALSVDARPINKTSTIPMGIQCKEKGAFRIRVAKNNLPQSLDLFLHDKKMDKWMPLEKDSSYLFSIETDTTGLGKNRFEITASKKNQEGMSNVSRVKLRVSPVPAKDYVNVAFTLPEWGNTSVSLLNLSGNLVKNRDLGLQKEGGVTIPTGDLVKGLYLIRLQSGKYLATAKMIKQ